MMKKPPSSDTSERIPRTSPTQAAEEALDLALVTATLVTLTLTYCLVAWTKLTTCLAVICIIGADVVFVLLVVPHVVANWLGYDVHVLLGMQSSDQN